jgi:hypothetical protein
MNQSSADVHDEEASQPHDDEHDDDEPKYVSHAAHQ